MSKEIVVRLVTPSGRSRIVLPPTATLGDFQSEVQTRTGVEAAAQKLALDPKGQRPVSGAPTALLAQLGIVNGAQLHLVNSDANIAAQVLTKVPVPVEPEKPVARTDGGAGNNGSASSSTAAAAATAPAAPAVPAASAVPRERSRGSLTKGGLPCGPFPRDGDSSHWYHYHDYRERDRLKPELSWRSCDLHHICHNLWIWSPGLGLHLRLHTHELPNDVCA
mmetsp:Transcript_92550/g.239651  ORF Transcript_92550/g.239651 Transcript_92550/m.239651 type:complete len:221 (+) Transcript_92550:152-814(+)